MRELRLLKGCAITVWGKINSGLAGVERLNEILGRAVFWCLLLMVLMGTFNALARKVDQVLQDRARSQHSEGSAPTAESGGADFTLSSNAYLELQWYLFSFVFLLGAPYALKHNGHVRVDVLYDRLSPRTRSKINLIGHLCLLLPFAFVMFERSLDPVWEALRTGETSGDPGGLSRIWIKPLVPIAFALLFLQALAEIAKEIRALRLPKDAGGMSEATHSEASAPLATEEPPHVS